MTPVKHKISIYVQRETIKSSCSCHEMKSSLAVHSQDALLKPQPPMLRSLKPPGKPRCGRKEGQALILRLHDELRSLDDYVASQGLGFLLPSCITVEKPREEHKAPAQGNIRYWTADSQTGWYRTGRLSQGGGGGMLAVLPWETLRHPPPPASLALQKCSWGRSMGQCCKATNPQEAKPLAPRHRRCLY